MATGPFASSADANARGAATGHPSPPEGFAARARRKLRPLRGRAEINRVVGHGANRMNVFRHSEIEVEADKLCWSRRDLSVQPPEGLPVQSLRTLLEHMGTLTLDRVTLTRDDPHEFDLPARKAPQQREAFALLGVDPVRIVSNRLRVGCARVCATDFDRTD